MKLAKRILCALLACCMILALTACGGENLKKLLPSFRAQQARDASQAISGPQPVTFFAQSEAGQSNVPAGGSVQITLTGDAVTVLVRGAASARIVWEAAPQASTLPD